MRLSLEITLTRRASATHSRVGEMRQQNEKHDRCDRRDVAIHHGGRSTVVVFGGDYEATQVATECN